MFSQNFTIFQYSKKNHVFDDFYNYYNFHNSFENSWISMNIFSKFNKGIKGKWKQNKRIHKTLFEIFLLAVKHLLSFVLMKFPYVSWKRQLQNPSYHCVKIGEISNVKNPTTDCFYNFILQTLALNFKKLFSVLRYPPNNK